MQEGLKEARFKADPYGWLRPLLTISVVSHMAFGICISSDLLSKSGESHSPVEPGLCVLDVGASLLCCLFLLRSTIDSDLL